jgi:hypothetical protein
MLCYLFIFIYLSTLFLFVRLSNSLIGCLSLSRPSLSSLFPHFLSLSHWAGVLSNFSLSIVHSRLIFLFYFCRSVSSTLLLSLSPFCLFPFFYFLLFSLSFLFVRVSLFHFIVCNHAQIKYHINHIVPIKWLQSFPMVNMLIPEYNNDNNDNDGFAVECPPDHAPELKCTMSELPVAGDVDADLVNIHACCFFRIHNVGTISL